jgi:dethiobiotin synthetase
VRGLFVTGTDTGVGKTVVCGALLAAMAEAGERPLAYKPVVTGLDEADTDAWPADHELLARVSSMAPEDVSPLRYGPAASPQHAASLAGQRIEPARLLAAVPASGERPLIVEGVGGLLTPLADGYTVRELAAALGLALVVVARPGLGTINHTQLTLEAARAASLEVRAVILTPWPAQPSRLERSNRVAIARAGGLPVERLGWVRAPEPHELARAGTSLPCRDWLSRTRAATSVRRDAA